MRIAERADATSTGRRQMTTSCDEWDLWPHICRNVGRSRLFEMRTSSAQFLINLCSLDSPITVPQPRAPRLTRYSFFITHSWENGRRQYHLHMGYFGSIAEADKWLATLKRVYPDAHVGEAPESQPDLMSSTQ